MLVKNCIYCRNVLAENATVSKCEKCIANEAKYGKPDQCKYCLLPAGFVEKKCVYCAHAERKNGAPVACNKCQIKCAFPKDRTKNKPTLCRRCEMERQGPGAAKPSASSSATKRQPSSHSKSNSVPEKKTKTDVAASKPTTSARTATVGADASDSSVHAEHIVTIQQLKEQIFELNRTIREKEQLVQEKDRKIAELSAQMMSKDKDYRQKVAQVSKQNADMMEQLREQLRAATKQANQQSKTAKGVVPMQF